MTWRHPLLTTPRHRARPLRSARLASLALLLGGCILVVDDPDGWTVDTGPDGGPGGSSADGAGPGVSCHGLGDGYSCYCDATAPGDDDNGTGPACGDPARTDELCCGDVQYPAANTTCECRRLSCKLTLDGCECSLGYGVGPDSSCRPRDGETCCRSFGSCRCGTDLYCSVDDVVPSCQGNLLSCGTDHQWGLCSPLPR